MPRVLAEHRGAATARRRWSCAARSRQGVRPHRRLRRRDRRLVRAATLGEARRDWRTFARQLRAGAALRREPAPAGRLLRRPGDAASGRRHGRAAPGQGAVLQQPQRHRRGASSWWPSFGTGTPAVAIIKHANPCGVGRRRRPRTRPIARRLRCDPVSAFGGIVALNRPLDAAAAEEIAKIFTEVVIAPDATDEAKAHLRGEEEPAAADHGRACPTRARPASWYARWPAAFWRRRATTACVDVADLKVVTQAQADRARAGRPALRLQGRQARQVERHRLRQGRRDGRHRRGPDEPRRFCAHRRAERRGRRKAAGRPSR